MNLSSLFLALFSVRALRMAGWGALGGVVGFLLGEPFQRLFGTEGDGYHDPIVLILITAVWTALIGVGIGATILAGDNTLSLRGRWNRDLPVGVPLFLALGAVSGGLAQAFYSPALHWAGVTGEPNPLNPAEGLQMLIAASLVRGVAWAVLGAGLGIGIGLLRRDWKAALRGALGGIVGGYHGGAAFDFIGQFVSSGGGTASRCIGLILTGAAIAWCMRVAQEALRSAWLLGISTGPYEGKECPLNTARVSVGRSGNNDLALSRDETVPPNMGAFVFQNGGWWWEGATAIIDGVPQTKAPVRANSVIQLGTYKFKFFDRARTRHHAPSPLAMATPSVPLDSDQNAVAASPPIPVALPPVPNPSSGVAPPRVQPRPVVPSAATQPMPVSPVSQAAPSAPAIAGQLLVLTPLDAVYRPFSLGMAARATVGRAPSNDWALTEATVSGQHALLTLEGNVLTVRDLNSTNGTFVNGQKLAPNAPTPLREGDRVVFGKIECFVGRK